MATDSISEALGGFGSGTRLQALGKEWTFIFDIPKVVSIMEEMCLQWRREAFQSDLDALPQRNVPGSFDQQMAATVFNEYREQLRNGDCSAPRQGPDGTTRGGKAWQAWMQTKSGEFSMFLSALQIRHPEATMATLNAMTDEKPGEIAAMMLEMGNAVRDAVTAKVASLKTAGPIASEWTEKAEAANATLSGILNGLRV